MRSRIRLFPETQNAVRNVEVWLVGQIALKSIRIEAKRYQVEEQAYRALVAARATPADSVLNPRAWA